MTFHYRRDKKDLTSHIRSVRLCCVELSMPCTENNFGDFQKTVGFITALDKVLNDLDEVYDDAGFLNLVREFSKTTMVEVNNNYKKGKKEYIDKIIEKTLVSIEEVFAPLLKNATDRQKQRYETSLSNFKEVITKDELTQAISRLFTIFVKKEEIPKYITPELQKYQKIVDSYHAFKISSEELDKIFDKLGSSYTLSSTAPPAVPQKEAPKNQTPFPNQSPLNPKISPFTNAPSPLGNTQPNEVVKLQLKIKELNDEIEKLQNEKEEQVANSMADALLAQGELQSLKSENKRLTDIILQLQEQLEQQNDKKEETAPQDNNENGKEEIAHLQDKIQRLQKTNMMCLSGIAMVVFAFALFIIKK